MYAIGNKYKENVSLELCIRKSNVTENRYIENLYYWNYIQEKLCH